MFGFLKSKSKPDLPPTARDSAVIIPWKGDATLPIPDWDAIVPDKTAPDPGRWQQGVERGQFRFAACRKG